MTNVSATPKGKLYIVATPIGHLDDITLRAISVLKSVDIILTEDTRHSKTLLSHYGISKPMVAFHEHNESEKIQSILKILSDGQSIALISDAGTPLISDPGYPLVSAAKKEGFTVIPIPGASALLTALSASGLPTDCFTYAGFLPARSSARINMLKHYQQLEHTVIFFESTHRILACFEDLISVYGKDAQMVLAKELTKTFETILNDTVLNIYQWLTEDSHRQKGEFVLIFPKIIIEKPAEGHDLLAYLIEEVPLKQAVKIASHLTGQSKNTLYALAISLKKDMS